MARKKAEADHGNCIVHVIAYFTLAAWCLIAASAQNTVYTVVFRPDAADFAGMAAMGLDVSAQNDVVLESTLGAASEYYKTYDYSSCFRGVAIALSPEQVTMMRDNPAIMSIEMDSMMTVSTTHSRDYMALPGGAWIKSGGIHSAGEDVVIGVVDTGIYPDHPSFAATDGVKPYPLHPTFKGVCKTDARVPNGFCNGKIVGANQFFEGFKMSGSANLSDPDINSPLDGNGHGTHCAGTAAGNYAVPVVVHGSDFGFASGSAPRARIAVYKALTAQGQGTMSDSIAAIDQAIKDGVHVISLSLGPTTVPVGNVTYLGNFELACLGAVKAGIFVANAAGNKGPGTSTSTSYSPWLTSVGASTMDRSYPNYLYTGDGKNYSGQGLAPPTSGTKSYALISAADAVATGMFVNSDFDCADETALNKNLILGKILVCTWTGVQSFDGNAGTLSRVAAKAMGAVGVVLLTTNLQYFETKSPADWYFQDFPGIAIWGSSAQLFLKYYTAASANAAGATGRIGGGATAVYTGLPPVIAPFSGRGPGVFFGVEEPSPTDQPVADVLKPSLVAPGVGIWSSWSPLPTTGQGLFLGQKWSMISGTSMACPHLAGVAAIVRQVHPLWTPSTVASALATTAIPLDSLDNPLLAYDNELDQFGRVIQQLKRPGNAFDFGAGFVDASSALDPGLIFDATHADYIKFLCSVGVVTAARVKASTSETCPATKGLSTDLNLPSITVGTLNKTRSVPRVVTNVGPLETYTAVVTPPADVEVVVDPATFTIAPGATQSFTITLTALKSAFYVNQTSFGRIYLTGNLGHRVQMPVTVTYRIV